MLPEDAKALIREEQLRQSEKLIEQVGVEEYIEKIQSRAEVLCHYVEGSLAGLVAFYCNDQKRKMAFITLVVTSPERRGKRLAMTMVRHVLWLAKSRGFASCRLEVRKDNTAALALYTKIGFAITNETDGRYVMDLALDQLANEDALNRASGNAWPEKSCPSDT